MRNKGFLKRQRANNYMWFPVLGSFVSQSFPDVSMTQFKNILIIKFNFTMSNCREIFPINDEVR